MRETPCRRRAAPDPDGRPLRRSRETRPKLRNLEPRTQAHYCSAMTQTQKLLLAIGILGLTAIAANRFAPAGKGGTGDACSRFVNEARRTCYSQLLSERLTKYGVADAVATLDAIAAADRDVAEHAHEFAHGLGIEAYGR